MNFLLGFLVILGVRLGAGDYAFMASTLIGRVEATSPLKAAGLLPGDQVASVAGQPVTDWEEMTRAFAKAQGTSVLVDLLRGEQALSLQVAFDPSDQALGIDPFIPSGVGSILPGYPAEAAGLRCLIGTDQESTMGTAAQIHVGVSMPNLPLPCDPMGPVLYMASPAKARIRAEGSYLYPPEGAGLGVELDENKLKELTIASA